MARESPQDRANRIQQQQNIRQQQNEQRRERRQQQIERKQQRSQNRMQNLNERRTTDRINRRQRKQMGITRRMQHQHNASVATDKAPPGAVVQRVIALIFVVAVLAGLAWLVFFSGYADPIIEMFGIHQHQIPASSG